MSDSDPWPQNFSFKKFRQQLSRLTGSVEVDSRREYTLGNKKIRVPLKTLPLDLSLENGTTILEMHPEFALSARGKPGMTGNLLLRGGGEPDKGVRPAIRLIPGQALKLGTDSPDQQALLDLDRRVGGRHLLIKLFEDEILLKNLLPGSPIRIRPLDAASVADGVKRRVKALRRLRRIVGRRIEPLAAEPALKQIQALNGLLAREAHRPTDQRGMPGGVVSLPKRLTPIIVGDLGLRIDNLLAVLSQEGVLEALEGGDTCLIILGDAVDPQTAEPSAAMALVDLIFALKLHFPEQVYYLRGDHDGLCDDAADKGKGSGRQAPGWRRLLRESRGKKYLKEMERFFGQIPYVAYSSRFVACHAGAPKVDVTRDMLINVRQYPGLERELTQNRVSSSTRKGYSKGDVKRLRKGLELSPDIPFVVGHTPLSADDTLWTDAGEIKGHHLVYSGGADCVGALTFVGDSVVPLRYPGEPLLELFNSLPEQK